MKRIWSVILSIKKPLIICLIVLIAISGWAYFLIRENDIKSQAELSALNNSFIQRYGNKVVMKQLAYADKVYSAIWSDENGVTHISWCVNGFWLEVGNNQP